MNKNVRFEQLTSIDNTISIEKLVQSSSTHEPVIGKVILYDPTHERFEVNLGNGLSGILPLVDSTVYPLLLPNGELSKSLQYIIGKKIIVTVKSVTFKPKGNPTIVLSRKDSMLDSFNTISNLTGNVIECCITAFSTFGIFVDVGNGICGLIHHKNLCLPRIYDFKSLGINIGDTITAKVISVDDNFHVALNYKDQFENLAFALKQNDLIEAQILTPINKFGYFVYLNPATPAVVDVPEDIPCSFGDKVLVKVKGTRKKHPECLKLEFVSFID